MPAKRPPPADECLRVLEAIRATGATHASVTVGRVAVEASWDVAKPKRPRDLTPAVGFMLDAGAAEED